MEPLLTIIISTYDEGILELKKAIKIENPSIKYLIVFQNPKHIRIPDFLNRKDIDIIDSKTKGLSVSRNIGIENCKTPYALLSDDDVEYIEEGLDQVLEIIQKEKIEFITKKDNTFFKKIYEYIDFNQNLKSKHIYSMVLFKFYLWLKYNSLENIFNSNVELNLDDYISFLKNPTPNEIFTGYKVKLIDMNWKPFNNGLNSKSILQHCNVIKKFLNFYKIKFTLNEIETQQNLIEFILNEEYLKDIILHIDKNMFNFEKNSQTKKNRLKWVIILLFFTGVKVKDVFNIKMNDIKKEDKHYYIEIFNSNNFNRINLSDFFIKEFLKYKKQYGKKYLVDKKNNSSMILSISGQIEIKLNTIQKEFIKLKNDILNDPYYDSDNYKNFKVCISKLSLIKIREYAILKLIQENKLTSIEIKKFFNLNEQTYKKYVNKFIMINNLGYKEEEI